MARRKASDKKATEKKNRASSNIQADHYSIAFEQVQIEGNVGGDIRIGHTIGYTAEQVSVLLKQITTTLQPKKFDGRCPYKGLEVFEEEDAELFFGRERLVNELVGRVKESRTVFITGPSGSGKSSLVRAGLIHALKQGAIKGSERWLYETMKPGREPIKDLALAFSRLKSPELQDYFLAHLSETDILNKCAESVLSGRKDQRFVLFVDQFEEVFTQINSEEERIAFINMLAHAGTIENGRVIVLFAMRSDFVSNCATYPALNELLSQEFRQIGAMQPEELVSAIALPAMHVGLPVEHELIAQIINDMRGEPDALPLMQFALKDLFDAKQAEGGVIALTLKDYLQHGGIHKSLERHADATFAQLSESEQELTRSIFSGLIEIGRGTQDTKRTALFDELVPANTKAEDVLAIVQKLADARLIITDEQAGKDMVTISHEKLIEAWPWLKKLVNENRDAIALQNEIASDAKEWEDHNRDLSYLYSGARLANVREQLNAKKLVLSETSNEFVRAGQGQEKRNRRVRIMGVAVPIGLVIVAVILFSYISSANSARLAEERLIAVNTQAALVSTSQAVAVTAQAAAEEAQKQANIALARQLAVQSESLNLNDKITAIQSGLLAVEAGKRDSSLTIDRALRRYLSVNPLPIVQMIHDGHLRSVAFSSDGKYLVSGGDDGTVRVWDVSEAKEVRRLLHDQGVTSVAFSSDGRYIVSGSYDKLVRVWSTATGNEISRMSHDFLINSVAFSPDDQHVVSGSADNTVRIWEAATGKEVARMAHGTEVKAVAFSPDGRYIVSGGGFAVRIWEAATGKEVARITHDGPVTSVVFTRDSQYVVSGSGTFGYEGLVLVSEVTSGKGGSRLTNTDNGIEGVLSLAVSPDGKYVILGNEDDIARIWELKTGKEVVHMIHDDDVLTVSFSPDGKYAVSGSRDGMIIVWAITTGNEVAHIAHGDRVNSVAFSCDGKYVVSGGEDRSLRVWEATSGKEIHRMLHDAAVNSVDINCDGKYIASGSGDGSVRVWEASTGKEIARMTHGVFVTSVDFSADGKFLVSGGCDKGEFSEDCTLATARVWEIATGKEIARTVHNANVFSVAFSPAGRYIVSGGSSETVHILDVATGKEITHVLPNGPVMSVGFSWDGKYVVARLAGGIMFVWEAISGNEVGHLELHDTSYQAAVAFSPDGRFIASGAREYILVWEVSSGNEYARINTGSWVNSIAWNGDGRYIVSGSDDGMARIWYWETKDLVSEVCKRLSRNFTHAEWASYMGSEPSGVSCTQLAPELEVTPTPSPRPTATFNPTVTLEPSIALININTASLAELETLPGIGSTTAQKIIDYRTQNGPFLNIEDIMNVSGVGPGTYEGIKNLITVGP